MELKYHNSQLSYIYEQHEPDSESIDLKPQNIQFVQSLQEEIKEFYDYEMQKKITVPFTQ